MHFRSFKALFLSLTLVVMIGMGFALNACNTDELLVTAKTDDRLQLLHVFDLDLPEPSGLTLNDDASALYVVSDPPDNQVRKISLQGVVLKTLSYIGDDLEGITYDISDHTLWLVEEQEREIVHIDTFGSELERFSVDYPGQENSGFEGIVLSHDNKFVVLNEKNPGMILQIDINGSILNEIEPGTALDYSGICYIQEIELYLIISDESKQLMVFNTDYVQEDVYALNVDQAEGITYNHNQNLLYIVSDKTEQLYIYGLDFDFEVDREG